MSTTFDEPTAPHCVACGATARRVAGAWYTEHEDNCPWMADRDPRPYD